MEYIGFVYLWENKINNKKYIGLHKGSEDDGYTGSGPHFVNAIKKYGIDNFVREILYYEYESLELLYQKEYELINFYNAVKDEMYYNKTNISPNAFGFVDGELTRAPFSESHKKNIAKARIGKLDSDATKMKKKNSSSLKGTMYYNNNILEGRFIVDKQPEGWLGGRLANRLPECGKGMVIWNNGKTNKRFPPTEVPNGWVKGSIYKGIIGDENPAKRPEVREKISKSQKGIPRPKTTGDNNPAKRPEVREKIAKQRRGKMLYTNGIDRKFFNPDEVPSGWIISKTKNN